MPEILFVTTVSLLTKRNKASTSRWRGRLNRTDRSDPSPSRANVDGLVTSWLGKIFLTIFNGIRNRTRCREWEPMLSLVIPMVLLALAIWTHRRSRTWRKNNPGECSTRAVTTKTQRNSSGDERMKNIERLEAENKLLVAKLKEMEVALKKFL